MAFLAVSSGIIGNGWYCMAVCWGCRVVLYGVSGGIVWRFGWYCMAYPILGGDATDWYITSCGRAKIAICLYLCYLMYKHKYARMLCVAHTPILYLFFLFPYGEKWGFKVEASPRPQPVIFRSFLFGYDLNKWGTNGEPLRRYTPIGGGGGEIPKRGIPKTTPPNARVQCQNFRNFGKRKNGLTSACNGVFVLQIQS